MATAVEHEELKHGRAKADGKIADRELKRIDQLLSQMTSEEKAGQLTQLFALPFEHDPLPGEIAAGRVGSVLFARDCETINRLQKIALEESRLKIPLLFGFDVVHGLRTIFPVPIALAASWDPALVENVQAVAATEATAVGLHWTFAPVADIARDPRWGRIVEGAGEDPYLSSIMAAAQVKGFQGEYLGKPGRLLAGPKHFAGYGAAQGGRDYDEVNLSESELRNVYLPPFKAAIEAGAGNIMCAYMGLNGVPASGNAELLRKILREELGFEGFVVSDANSVFDLETHGLAMCSKEAAVRALRAGVDMEMALTPDSSAYRTLPESMTLGELLIAELDDSVRRILELKFKLGLFERPYVDAEHSRMVLKDPSHRNLARVAAERSFVLLKNEKNILPLRTSKLKKIAVIGPLANSARDILGPWSVDYDLAETITVLDGLRTKLDGKVAIEYSPGVTMPKRLHPSFFDELPGFDPALRIEVDDDQEISRAVILAKASDCAILVLGEAQEMIGEGASRASLDLPGRQQELLDAVISAGKPVVLLLMCARPIDLKGAAPSAILNIWYPGTQGGLAVANTLFGETTPGGKLPFNWPRSIGQLPLPYGRTNSHKPADAARRYWDEVGEASYPFGFGLSYTSVVYSDRWCSAKVIELGASVCVGIQVENCGDLAAEEVVQLYIHQRHGECVRPVRELKGFQRMRLEPGERRNVVFDIGPEQLRYWSSVSRSWVQDASTIDVFVGSDSSAPMCASFKVRKAPLSDGA